MKTSVDEAKILAINRPHKSLWIYYLLCCLVIPPLFPILVLPMWFRYYSMKYHFTDEGISMSWGILFRHETILNYARIQDIHLRSNIVERWLGLARILVQTASGSAAAELTLEGLHEFEAVRDFLYSRMRGVKDTAHHHSSPPASVTSTMEENPANCADLAATLREISREMRAIRTDLATRRGAAVKGPEDV